MTRKKPPSKPNISEEERQVFLDEIADVRPLVSEPRMDKVKEKPSPRNRDDESFNDDESTSKTNLMSDPADLRDAQVNDVLFFARSGIQQKLQKKLKRGDLPIEYELDLHGYTVVEAKSAIYEFIEDCKNQHVRYVHMIHGKGYRSEQKIPVLKTHVAYWLPQHQDVLAFSSCLPKDGGTGAIYVILKSSNK
ncbi:MAG: Smr/MutS family protein [Woeseiaceae bacterium]